MALDLEIAYINENRILKSSKARKLSIWLQANDQS